LLLPTTVELSKSNPNYNDMTNSPTPNPNRRRRLTADELIAIVVAMAGIGTVFFWGIGQKNSPLNLLQSSTTTLNGDTSGNRKGVLFGSEETKSSRERQTIASIAERERGNSAPPTIASPAPNAAPAVKLEEEPVEKATTPAQATAPSVVAVPVAPVAPPTIETPAPAVIPPVFTDVPKQFWGAGYIGELGKRGILDDFGTGKFDPTKPITRGEYAKMLDRAFADKAATTTTSSFKDIPTDYPRKEAVDGAVNRGFMTGYSPTKFAPNQLIPRYQLQISLAKGLQLPVATSQDKVLSKFTDAAKMPKYAREKMAAAVSAGLVIKDKTTNQLKPVQNATRADAAALIYEALVKEGKITPQP
jgi:S-layer homology domain